MLPLLAEIRSDAPVLRERNAARRTLRLRVSATASDATTALIHNLSESGLLLETDAYLQIGEVLQVDLPHAGATTALVVWSRGKFAGCEFVSPVSKASVSAALLVNPIQRAADPLIVRAPPTKATADWDPLDEEHSMVSEAALLVSLLISLIAAILLIVALLTFPFSMI